MQIYVHARSFLEARQGTKRERELFRDNHPIIVHCTAGISRSGAVGEVLNWYCNRFEADDSDCRKFEIMHPDIVPNAHVRRLLLTGLQRNHEKLRAKIKTGRSKYLRKTEKED